MCSDCGVGKAKAHSLEVTTIPEPGSILLEQWTISIHPLAKGSVQMNSLSLLQAVRSYLHFSQLSAWYSTTKGSTPWNILIRITIPGEEFESKFTQPPEKHYFPNASVGGNSMIAVSVRSLPRTEEIPKVVCAHNQQSVAQDADEDREKLGIAGALAWQDETDLRKSLVKVKLAATDYSQVHYDCPGRLIKSDSMDSILSDSLLDPPPSLAKMNPRRYQSPSRCGSPSLEAPEPLMGKRKQDQFPSQDVSFLQKQRLDSKSSRPNRHDLMRRRDLTLLHGLHPRMLHDQSKLSLPPSIEQQNTGYSQKTGMACDQNSESKHHIVNDCMPTHCNIAGKHRCCFEEEIHELSPSIASDFSFNTSPCPDQVEFPSSGELDKTELGAKQKGWPFPVSTFYTRDSSAESSHSAHSKKKIVNVKDKNSNNLNPECCSFDPELSPSELHEVLENLSSRNSPISYFEKKATIKDENLYSKSRRSSFEELLEMRNMCYSPNVTQVYRATVCPSDDVQPANPENSTVSLERLLLPPKKLGNVQDEIHSFKETNTYLKKYSQCSREESPSQTQNIETDLPSRASSSEDGGKHFKLTDTLDTVPLTAPFENCELPNNLPHPSVYEVLCHDLENKCLIKSNDQFQEENGSSGNSENKRTRSYSETAKLRLSKRAHLKPLDFSFKNIDNCWVADEIENLNDSTELNTKDSDVVTVNKLRNSIDSASSMIFRNDTGLPLTSSPAPMRKGINFDYDSQIITPKDIKRALYEAQSPEDKDFESYTKRKKDSRKLFSTSAPASITSNNNLLGNFEESVLNGRLEPSSTVEGFKAEIGASGSFQPKHLTFPVTVFFYSLCENSTFATPYLSHINLGKKGYRVPEKGTIQLTLFNPLGTVVKMFVVMYDLSDMPPNSQTFLRQRTLYMPSDASDTHEDAQKWLRYLIHLRVASSKSGKIYLHTDVRMIIFRKSDLDTAADHVTGKGFELRSFTHGPTNPKFSPRK